ncbi:MAG: GC-type dockerin domain-anchored protein [Phycisphaerales bacterium JB037]
MRLIALSTAVVVVAVPALADGPVEIRTDDHGHRAVAVLGYDAGKLGSQPGDAGARMTWSALGPFGGDVEKVAASPTASGTLLAGIAPASGTGGTMYRSTDGGASWTQIASFAGRSVYDIEFASSGTAYAGTIDGVWRSTDNGVTWTNLPLGIGVNDQVFDVEIDPGNDQSIWVGVADALGGQTQNVLQSVDGGASWTNRTPPAAAGVGCQSISVSPQNSNDVVLGFGGAFGGGAVFVSEDGGASWANRTGTIPPNPIFDVEHAGAAIYAGGGQAFGGQLVGLYRSTNGGLTWTKLDDASWPQATMNDLLIDPSDPNRLLVAAVPGVHASTDGGSTWTTSAPGTGSASTNSIVRDPGNPSTVYVGASSIAVLLSTDDAASFAPSAVGIGALNVEDARANPNDTDEIAIAFQGLNDGGIFSSTDGGTTWTLENTPGTRWNEVGWHPDGTLYALSDGPTSIAPEALYRRNGDATWTSIGPDQGTVFESELFCIRFSRNDPDLILLGGNDFGVAGFEGTIWKTPDRGGEWLKEFEEIGRDFRTVTDIVWVEDGTDTVAVASMDDTSSTQEGTALRSIDGGDSWSESATGLAAGRQGFALATSPTDPQTIFYADGDTGTGNGGVWVSTNAGQSWSKTAYVGGVRDLEVDPNDASVLYAMQFSVPRVIRSEDGGDSFAPFDDGLATAGNSRGLSMNGPASAPKLLFASSTGSYALDLDAGACRADLTGSSDPNDADYGTPDGVADADDFFFYLDAFVAQTFAVCDITGSSDPNDPSFDSPDGDCDADDFFRYLDLFVIGCP